MAQAPWPLSQPVQQLPGQPARARCSSAPPQGATQLAPLLPSSHGSGTLGSSSSKAGLELCAAGVSERPLPPDQLLCSFDLTLALAGGSALLRSCGSPELDEMLECGDAL